MCLNWHADMASPPRIELAGGLYHVIFRVDGREDIYREEEDLHAWLVGFGQVRAIQSAVPHLVPDDRPLHNAAESQNFGGHVATVSQSVKRQEEICY